MTKEIIDPQAGRRALAGRLASLSPDRLQTLLRRLAPTAAAPPPRLSVRAVGLYPLSSAQERIWLLTQLAADSTLFNNPGALRARAERPLERRWLQQALDAVGRRHEILRTTFHAEDGPPGQRIHDHLPLPLLWEDLRGLSPAEQTAAMERLAVEEGRRLFDLAQGPLLVLKVAQLGPADYLLLITSHHIVSDGWSNAMFARELSTAYGILAGGGDPAALLPPADRQYVDSIAWEQQWLAGDDYPRQLAYWRDRLDPQAPPLALPTDHPRPAGGGGRGSLERDSLPAALTARLQTLAREERVGLYPLLMAAMMTLLHRISGSDWISVGTSTANRDRREFQAVFGPFINTLVIRAPVEDALPFRRLLHQVADLCREAQARQSLPFDRLIGELAPRRDPGVHPLFQVMLVHQNVPSLYEVPGMRLEVLKFDYGTTKFDLNLWTEEVGDRLLLTLHYARDLFEPATIRRLLGQFRRILEDLVASPDRPVGDLPGYGAEELSIAAEPLPVVGEPLFLHRFAAAVAAHAGCAAVEDEDGSLSYEQLDAAATLLAGRLRRRGIGAGQAVGLLTGRGRRMIIGLLGILKAGAAYLPLDPGMPPVRLRAVLADAAAPLVVTEARFRPQLEGPESPPLLLLSDADDVAAAVPLPEVAPADAIYLIYTSGTSGTPKGVVVEHRQVMAYCDAVWPRLGLAAGARFATVSSLAADLGNTMIFPPLAHGGTVVVVPEDRVTDAGGLADFLTAHPVDCLKIVPSHLRALLAGERPQALLPRRLLVLGGEASDGALVAAVRALVPECRILNHYGPTETTIGVLTHEVGEAPAAAEILPLGRPLAGTRLRIVDGRGRPLPVGIPGELWIGGAGLARGYWNRPELTAEKFQAADGLRWYRSGDRVMRRDSGEILFLGRTDRQIKIRGHRIEPGEIERVLSAHPAVAQAVVAPPATDDPRQRLTAFVLWREGAAETSEALARFLRARLPAPLVPAVITALPALPLTANGKIDHAALAALAHRTQENVRPLAVLPPRDTIELALAQIWRDLLGGGEPGIDEDFFALGGHSLLAVQLMARIGRRFGLTLPLASLLEQGTIQGLAGLIRARADHRPASPLVTVQPRGEKAPLLFVHPAGGNVLCYYPLAQAIGAARPFHAYQALPSAVGEREDESIVALAERYLVVPRPGTGTVPVLGGWSMGALVAFEMACRWPDDHRPVVLVLDQMAPDPQPPAGDADDLSRLLIFVDKVSELVGSELILDRQALAAGSPEDRAAAFLTAFQAHHLVPEGTTIAAFQGFLVLMLRHNRITTAYRPGVYEGRVVVFRAEAATPRPADLGWGRYSSQPVTVIPVAGRHVSMMRPPYVAELGRSLAGVLG